MRLDRVKVRSVLYTFHSFGINVHLGFKELTGFKLSCRKCTRDSYHFLLLSVSIGFLYNRFNLIG